MKRAFIVWSFASASFALASPPAHPPAVQGHAETSSKTSHTTTHDDHGPHLPPRQALARLVDGNERFRYGESTLARFDAARRSETSTSQNPFAAVLSCSDSRLAVEMIFDQGIGDLLIARVNGNVASEAEIGTLEHGVANLGTGLIVVLGHAHCDAVSAVAEGASAHGNAGRLLDEIAPAVSRVKQRDPEARGARLLRLAIRANVQQSMSHLLTRSDTIAKAIKAGKVQVVGGVYDLQSGAVDWIGEHPDQAELLGASPPISKPEPLKHGSQTAPHGAAPDPGHGDTHDDHGTSNHSQAKPSKAAATPRQENWIALGSLLGVSLVGSFGTIHFVYGRKPHSAVAPG